MDRGGGDLPPPPTIGKGLRYSRKLWGRGLKVDSHILERCTKTHPSASAGVSYQKWSQNLKIRIYMCPVTLKHIKNGSKTVPLFEEPF